MMNCKNCGAPLRGGKCEYCGTEYEAAPRRGGVFLKDREALARHLRDEWLYGKMEDPPQLEFASKYQRIQTEKLLLATYPPFPEAE